MGMSLGIAKIELKNIVFSRDDRLIFNNFSASIPENKVIAIMGPSGCGKTTLLKLITREVLPDNGDILFDGQSIVKLKRKELFSLRKKIGILFQSGALFTGLNVYENVAFPLREQYYLPEEVIKRIVLIQLEMVGLRGAVNLMPMELSGGMARRVALARALVTNPQLMLYDEPFAGQDPVTMGVLAKLIKEINYNLGITSIIVSHDVQETFEIADFVYVISGGNLIGYGTPEQIKNNASPLLKQFLNGLADGPIPFHYASKLNYYQDLEI